MGHERTAGQSAITELAEALALIERLTGELRDAEAECGRLREQLAAEKAIGDALLADVERLRRELGGGAGPRSYRRQ